MPGNIVSFFNDGDFIRVVDIQANTTVYFNKTNLSVQMDNDKSFYLKNDSNIGFYNYDDIEYPCSGTIKELVYILVEWAKFRVDTWNLSNAISLMELQMNVDANLLEIDTYATKTGTNNRYDPNTQLMRQQIILPTGKSIRQSKMYINYRLGQDTLAVMSGTLIEPDRIDALQTIAPQNILSRIGLFEDHNEGCAGYFFQFKNTIGNDEEISVVLRRGQVDTEIPQNEWNIDKLNGQGPSVLNVNFRKNMTFVFEMRNRQGTVMRMGIMHNDLIVFCHEFSDSVFGTSMTSEFMPSLPLRWEIQGVTSTVAGATSSGSMLQGYAIVYGKQNRTNNDIRVFGTNSKQKLLYANEVNKNLIALSLQSNRIRCRAQLTKIQIINTQTGFARWDLILNPRFEINGNRTDPSFDLVENTIIQRNDSNDTIDADTILATGFIGSNAIETIVLDDQFASLMARIDGTPDVIALRINGMFGTTNVAAAVSWREYI